MGQKIGMLANIICAYPNVLKLTFMALVSSRVNYKCMYIYTEP